MFEILVTDRGSATEVGKKLTVMADETLTLAKPLAEISADIFIIEGEIFASGGRRGGGSWAPLKPETIKRKGSFSILVDTGALYASLTRPGAPFQILDITNESLVFGTDRPWAFVHQEGSRTNPKRPFIRFLPRDIDRWTGMILRHLTKIWHE